MGSVLFGSWGWVIVQGTDSLGRGVGESRNIVPCVSFLKKKFFFLVFYSFPESEPECEQGRGRERGRQRIQSKLQAQLRCQT